MVNTKTFDNIDKEKEIDNLFKDIFDELRKTKEDLREKLLFQNAEDIKRLKVEYTIVMIGQAIINILLAVAIILK